MSAVRLNRTERERNWNEGKREICRCWAKAYFQRQIVKSQDFYWGGLQGQTPAEPHRSQRDRLRQISGIQRQWENESQTNRETESVQEIKGTYRQNISPSLSVGRHPVRLALHQDDKLCYGDARPGECRWPGDWWVSHRLRKTPIRQQLLRGWRHIFNCRREQKSQKDGSRISN